MVSRLGRRIFLIQEVSSWNNTERVLIFNGDIASAFDHLSPQLMAKAMAAAKVHPKLVAAMVYENLFLECHPDFQGISLEHGVPFTKCARQGGMESAYAWNMVMYMVLDLLVPLWYDSGYGVTLNGRRYTHIIWADNVWLLATCPEDLQKMINSLADIFHHHSLEWKLDSLMFIDSLEGAEEILTTNVDGKQVSIPYVDGMPVLGTWLDRKGATSPSVGYRLSKASKMFWSQKALFTDKCLPLSARLDNFASRVVPRALHGASSWAWSKSLYWRLQRWESQMLRMILGSRRRPAEDWMSWIKRATAYARKQYTKLGHKSLAELYLQSLHRLAGRVGRSLRSERVPIFLADAITWKDTAWWHQTQRIGYTDGVDAGRWRHAAGWNGRKKKWDMPLVYHYGDTWMHCSGTEGWQKSQGNFVESAFDMIGCHRRQKLLAIELSGQPLAKKPRLTFDVEQVWGPTHGPSVSIEFLGDSEVVINWINGASRCTEDSRHLLSVSNIMNTLHEAWKDNITKPRQSHLPWCRHIFRELNKDADAMATLALTSGANQYKFYGVAKPPPRIKVYFDGGRRDSKAAYGWVVFASFSTKASENDWIKVAYAAAPLGDVSTNVAELTGASEAINWTLSWLRSF